MALPGGRSVRWSAIMTSNTRNLKLPFLAMRCLYWGVGLPVDLPIWVLTVEASWSDYICCNSWNLILPFLTPRCHYQGVDLPLDLPLWALLLEIWNCHSWPLDGSIRGVDLPVDLPIWALIVEASWSVNMSSNSRNVKLLFLAIRWLCRG